MNNFHRIAHGIDVARLAFQVVQNEHRFVHCALHTNPEHPGYTHRECHVITLRSTPVGADFLTNEAARKQAEDEIIAANTEAFYAFTELHGFLYALMGAVRGMHIGRVSIVRLVPGASIYEHVDPGASAEFYQRYHLVVAGVKDNFMTCGEGDDEERVEMLAGEVWAFNCRKRHGLTNLSGEARVHCNLDISSA